MSLDPYIVIEYIKSSVDIILNLKFEEIEKRLLDKTQNNNFYGDSTLMEASQRHNGGVNFDSIRGAALSNSRSIMSEKNQQNESAILKAKNKNGNKNKLMGNHKDKDDSRDRRRTLRQHQNRNRDEGSKS